jgi:hypothetical protein
VYNIEHILKFPTVFLDEANNRYAYLNKKAKNGSTQSV